MKALTLTLLLFSALPARAAVVDEFFCTMNFQSPDGKTDITTDGLIVAIRQPFAPPQPAPTPGPAPTVTPVPAPSVRSGAYQSVDYTSGAGSSDIKTTVGGHQMSVTLGIEYGHVIAVGQDGSMHAGQNGCLTVAYSIDNQGFAEGCLLFPINPADPLGGYNPVPINNGVPGFDSGTLVPVTTKIQDLGTAKASCNYLGTQQ